MQGLSRNLGQRTLTTKTQDQLPAFGVGPSLAQVEIDGLMQFLNGMAKGDGGATSAQSAAKTPGQPPVLEANPHSGQPAVKAVSAQEEITNLNTFLNEKLQAYTPGDHHVPYTPVAVEDMTTIDNRAYDRHGRVVSDPATHDFSEPNMTPQESEAARIRNETENAENIAARRATGKKVGNDKFLNLVQGLVDATVGGEDILGSLLKQADESVVKRITGDTSRLSEVGQFLKDDAADNRSDRAIMDVEALRDIRSVDDLTTYATRKLGEGAGYLLPMFAAGSAAPAAGVAMGIGEMRSSLEDEFKAAGIPFDSETIEKYTLGFGALIGSLDAVGFKFLTSATDEFKKDVLSNATAAYAKNAISKGAAEAATEALQEGIQAAASKHGAGTLDWSDAGPILEQMAEGAFAGKVTGTAVAAATGPAQGRMSDKEFEQTVVEDTAPLPTRGEESTAITSHIETPAFKTWFEGSSVVDDAGQPLTLYHGTRAGEDFDTFEPGEGIGAHFGTTGAANDRLAFGDVFDGTIKGEGERVMPVHLAIRKPIELGDVRWEDPWEVAEAVQNKDPSIKIVDDNAIEGPSFDDVRKALADAGYDGIKYKNEFEDEGSTSYIALKPEQIKSATGNKGTFDPADSRIAHQKASIEGAKQPVSTMKTAVSDAAKILPKSARIRVAKTIEGMGEGKAQWTGDYLDPESSAFDEWKGKSKLLGEDGTLYHLTRENFEAFDPIRDGEEFVGDFGIHLGSPEAANNRALEFESTDNAQMMRVYVKASNVLTMPDGGWSVQSLPRRLAQIPAMKEVAKKYGFDDFGQFEGSYWKKSDAERMRVLARALGEAGFDVIRYKNAYEGGGWSYVKWNATDIKSATGNRGTYDPNDPRIAYQSDGAITGRFDPADPNSGSPLERTIWLSTQSKNPKQTLGHEGIHALKDMELFTKSEWNLLEKAAKDEGWLEKYKIRERYEGLSEAQMAEEAAAEAYGDYFANPKAIKNKGVQNLFERIKKFLQSINDTIRKTLGKGANESLTVEDVFGRISSGEVASRAGQGRGARVGAPRSATVQQSTLKELVQSRDPAATEHPDVQAAISAMMAIPETHKEKGYGSLRWKSERIFEFGGVKIRGYKLAQNRFYEDAKRLAYEDDGMQAPKNPVERGRRATIVIGAPAAGKSTIANPIARNTRSMIIDSDEVKKTLPEYQGGVGANAVHEESSEIADEVFVRAVENGDNILVPKVGGKAASISRLTKVLKEQNYSVDIVFADVQPQEAMRRMLGRFVSTGRLIPPNYLNSVAPMIESSYNELLMEGRADGFTKIDLSGTPEETIQKIEQSKFRSGLGSKRDAFSGAAREDAGALEKSRQEQVKTLGKRALQ